MQAIFNPLRAAAIPAALVSAALASTACGIDLMAQEEARNQWTKSYTLERGATVEILNTNGTIKITAGDGDAMNVVAERIVKASTEERAKELLADFEIRETVSADRVRLDSKATGMNLGVNRIVHYTITMPAWANVVLGTTNGDINVEGLTGELRVAATNGRIEGARLGNGATVDATNGAISLEFAALGDQGVDCETVNGTITLALPRDAGADVSARVTNGAISTGDLGLTITEESRRRIDGRLGPGGTRVRLETVNGAIRLRGR